MLNVAIINFRFNHFKHPKEQLKNLQNYFNAVLINVYLDMTDRTILNKLFYKTSDFVSLINYCKSLGLRVMIGSKFSTQMDFNKRIFTNHVQSKVNELISLGITELFCDRSGDVNYEKNYNDLVKLVQNKITLYDFQPIKDNFELIYGLTLNSLNKNTSEQMFFIPIDKLSIFISPVTLKYNNNNLILNFIHTVYYGIPKDYLVITNLTNDNYLVKKKNIEEYYSNFPDELNINKKSTLVHNLL